MSSQLPVDLSLWPPVAHLAISRTHPIRSLLARPEGAGTRVVLAFRVRMSCVCDKRAAVTTTIGVIEAEPAPTRAPLDDSRT